MVKGVIEYLAEKMKKNEKNEKHQGRDEVTGIRPDQSGSLGTPQGWL